MLLIRKADDRFHSNLGWLDSHHTFSFGEHHDAKFDGFRSLRVINDDTVAVGGGFPTHGHRDMDIISYVIEGALRHQDSMGNGSVIKPGDVQRMSAGTGVRHSEQNAGDGATHFLQIWLIPDRLGLLPSYEQKFFSVDDKRDRMRLVASGTRIRDGAVTLHEDAEIFATVLSPGARVEHLIGMGRHAWVHVVRGALALNGESLQAGDGAALSDVASVVLDGTGGADAEALIFDLA